MKKTIFVLSLFLFSSSQLYSQSSISLGVGVGQQFGLPGVRASYVWKRLDFSTNFGVFGGLEKSPNLNLAQRLFLSAGTGVSYRYTRKELLFAGYISYNFGIVFTKTFDGYNYITTPKSIHSLVLNYQFKYARFGFGISHIPTSKYGILPSLALGLMFPIWKK
jgi:hypothetical protein